MVHANDTTPLYDKTRNLYFSVGAFLGRGGFASCFELTDKNRCKFAGKVIEKKLVKVNDTKQKLQQEIMIHSKIDHKNIVKFISHFEDEKHVFILLELCASKSMHELLKRRKTLLIQETRYFSKQIAEACQYLHAERIIHRDLKLANVFLDKDICVKLGDFGLATELSSDDEKKKTMCGTPNYIAPEILMKVGHSFEVDVWSLGVIIYTLIFGKPPFETQTLQATYKLIKSNQYTLPHQVDRDVHNIITSMLTNEAENRPTMTSLLQMEFFKKNIPTCLPRSVLSCPPRFDKDPNAQNTITGMMDVMNIEEPRNTPVIQCDNQYLEQLQKQITYLTANKKMISDDPNILKISVDPMADSEDPKLSPIFWITKWVDYSDRYGLGYQLNDDSTAVLFNDETLLTTTTANTVNLQYIDKSGTEQFFLRTDRPHDLKKKVTLLDYFRTYMLDNLATTGRELDDKEKKSIIRLPYLVKYLRNKVVMCLYLSNGTIQVNFLMDHIKLIICPLMCSVTHIDSQNNSKTFGLVALQENGITKDMDSRLRYVSSLITKIKPYR